MKINAGMGTNQEYRLSIGNRWARSAEKARRTADEACLQEGGDDPAFIAHALGVIARARGMMQAARDAGMSREGLYKALSTEGNPSFGTILKVIKALGLQLHGSKAHT